MSKKFLQPIADKADIMETAIYAVRKHCPDFICAFVAGSVIRGDATPASDIDIVVFHDETFEDIQVKCVIEKGWPIELFMQNSKSCEFFMHSDRQRGMCAMMDMIASGIPIPDETEFTKEKQARAVSLIKGGPPALSKQDLITRRYFITDNLDDLVETNPPLLRFGTLANLYNQLGDLYLRGQGNWSGHGKALGRILQKQAPVFAKTYEMAFTHAYQGDLTAIRALTETVLKPYEGRCFEDSQRKASSAWQHFNA